MKRSSLLPTTTGFEMIDVAVIVVTFNVENRIEACLNSIPSSRGSDPIEVVVVDNASTDNSLRLASAFSGARVLGNPQNYGFARACNQGIQQTSSRYVLLLNPDARLQDGALDHLLQIAEKHPEAAVLGPRVRNPDGTIQGSARGFPDLLTSFFGRTSLASRWFPSNPLSRKNVPALREESNSVSEVDWVSGAAMLVRRKAFETVGLLDEGFFLFWEDADWCYRMRQNGWKVLYCTDAEVFHDVGASVATNSTRSTVEFHKSAYRWYVKHRASSPWNPMRWIAAIGLSARAVAMLVFVKSSSILVKSK